MPVATHRRYENALLLELVRYTHSRRRLNRARIEELARLVDTHSSPIAPSTWAGKRITYTLMLFEQMHERRTTSSMLTAWWFPLLEHVGPRRLIRDPDTGDVHNVARCLEAFAKKKFKRVPRQTQPHRAVRAQ